MGTQAWRNLPNPSDQHNNQGNLDYVHADNIIKLTQTRINREKHTFCVMKSVEHLKNLEAGHAMSSKAIFISWDSPFKTGVRYRKWETFYVQTGKMTSWISSICFYCLSYNPRPHWCVFFLDRLVSLGEGDEGKGKTERGTHRKSALPDTFNG